MLVCLEIKQFLKQLLVLGLFKGLILEVPCNCAIFKACLTIIVLRTWLHTSNSPIQIRVSFNRFQSLNLFTKIALFGKYHILKD